MTAYRYRRDGLVADYLRAGGGFGLMALLFFGPSAGPVVRFILVMLAVLFAVYGLRTWQRQYTAVIADEDGISTAGLIRASLAWGDLTSMKLSYYSTKREKGGGWMQLILGGAGKRLKIESTLEDFDQVVALAARHAGARRLELSPTTLENLRSLGVEPDHALMPEERT